MLSLYPFRRPGMRLPMALYGWHRLPLLRKHDARVQLHHLFHADLYPFPVLRTLRHPIVYTIVASVQSQKRPIRRDSINALVDAVVVSNQRDLETLQSLGIKNYHLIRPSIDVSCFKFTPVSHHSKFVLMSGSAPWTKAQFALKGVEALFTAIRNLPELHLVLLWRGLFLEELKTRICEHRLENRVKIINKKVDVNDVLGRVHASIVLASRHQIVKAYPHSLLESLAAGKPVIVSQSIPMADYVGETATGVIVPQVTPNDVEQAIQRLMSGYEGFQSNAHQAGQRDFSPKITLEKYRAVYNNADTGDD